MKRFLPFMLFMGMLGFQSLLAQSSALDFSSSSSQQVDLGTMPETLPSTFTIEAWIKPSAFGPAGNYTNTIFGADKSTGPSAGFALRCGSTGILSFVIGNGGWPEAASPSNTLQLNQWQHVAGTFNGDTIKLYVNGNLVSSSYTSSGITQDSAVACFIGASSFSGRNFDGIIENVRLWRVERTQAQIAANPCTPYTTAESDLVEFWTLDEGTGTTTTGVKGWSGNLMPTTTPPAWISANICGSCADPYGLSISNITDSSAIAHWSDPSGIKWDLFWGPSGFQQGSSGMTTTINPDTLGGLLPNTLYDFYVKTNCLDSSNGVSSLVGPFTFRTACAPYTAPYSDDFDSYSSGITPPCWTLAQTGGRSSAGQAYTSAFGANSAPNNIFFYNGYPAGPGDTTLFISPAFSDMNSSDKRIQFQAKASFGNGSIVVGSMSDPSDISSFNPIDTVSFTSNYSLFIIDFDATNGYNGTDQYVAFRHGNSSSFSTLYIDDFIYEQIPLCNPPLLSTLGADAGTSSASVYWGSGTDGNESHFEVGLVGFTPGANTFVFADSVAGNIDTSMVTGLAPQTTYEYYMRDSCAGNGFSSWVGPISFTTQCTSVPMPYYESFDTWPLACWDVDGGPQPWVEYVGTTNSYAEASFWNFFSTSNMVMTSRPVSIVRDAQIRFYWSHQYQSFYPSDKLIVRAKILGGQWDTLRTLSGPTFNAPLATSTTPGSFIEEEILLDAAVYTGHDVIVELRATSSFGPDLFINDFYIEDAPMCPNVANLTADNATDSSATLSWTGNQNASSYQVWFGSQGFFQGTQTVGGVKSVATADSLVVDTLSDNSCYEFLVRGICGPGDTSQWIGPFSFCTPCMPFTAPYQESFDSWPLSCWDFTGTKTWLSYAGPGTDQYALANFWGWSSGEAYMTSPVIQLNAQQAEVEFEWSHLYDASYPDDQILVIVSKVGSSIMDTILDLKGPSDFNDPTAGNITPGNFIKENILIDSATYANSAIQVTFLAITDYGPNAFVNNFKVKYPVSNDMQLLSGHFERDGMCLKNNDTIVLKAQNILGGTINFGNNSLVAHYNVTGPVNTSGTITLNTGSLSPGDTVSMMATNIDMSLPGVYTLDAYINPNPSNLDAVNDTLHTSVSINVYDDWSVIPDTVVIIANSIDTVVLEARSPFFGGGKFFFTEIRQYNTTGNGVQPSYLTSDDYIEITGVPNSDLGGITLEIYEGTTLTVNYTFPPGTLIGPNGTALIMQGEGAVASQPANFMYDGRGTSTYTYSSGSNVGYILKDGNHVVDAVAYNAFTFPASSGVTAADWSGQVPSASSTSGIRLAGPDNNQSTDWMVVSATSPQDPQVLNANVPLPSIGSVTGFSWTLNGTLVDTVPKTVVGPYTNSGVYNYIAEFTGPCGVFSDTVKVIVNLPGACPTPSNVAANVIACDSVEISWNTAADSAIVSYVPTGGTPGAGTLVVGDSSLTLTTTVANTSYDYYVANICMGDTSSTAGPFTFHTANAGSPVIAVNYTSNGNVVAFDASGSTGSSNVYNWDFGNGNSATGVTVSHTYATGGNKTVTLTVTNNCGSVDSTFIIAGVSLEEQAMGARVNLFPNPTNNLVHVEVYLNEGSLLFIELRALNGQLISSKSHMVNGSITESIDVSHLADGMYMIQIKTERGTINRKLIKE